MHFFCIFFSKNFFGSKKGVIFALSIRKYDIKNEIFTTIKTLKIMKTNLENNITLSNAIYYNSEVKNNLFNFFECIHDYDIPGVIEYFKENNITEFTISSTYSNQMEIYNAFQEAGFRMDGMVQVYSNIRDWHTHEYEKTLAIHFKSSK